MGRLNQCASFSAVTGTIYAILTIIQRIFLERYRRRVGDIRTIDDTKVTSALLQQVRHVGAIALPTLRSREFLATVLFLCSFGAKSFLVVKRLQTEGRVVQAFLSRIRQGPWVSRNFSEAISSTLYQYCAYAFLLAVVKGGISYLRGYLICAYRARLTEYFHNKFFEKLTFYHAQVLDDRIEDANTEITVFCHEFAEHFAELPFYFVLPFLEATNALIAIIRELDGQPTMHITSVVFFSLGLLRLLTPQFGKIHASVLAREAEFVSLHMDAKNNAEQLAMQDAGSFTKTRLDKAFGRLRIATEQMALAQGHFTMLETGITHVIWDLVAMVVCGRHLIKTRHSKDAASSVSSLMVQRNLIGSFYVAVKTFIVNFKELSHLSEFAGKLDEFDHVLDSIARGEFEKKPDPRFFKDGIVIMPSKEEYIYYKYGHGSGKHHHSSEDILPLLSPRLISKDALKFDENPQKQLIRFDDCCICAPNGVVLIEKLNLVMRQGENWVITGPNGCGKSSLLRILAGMWIPKDGTVSVNPYLQLFMLPQATYMVTGCTLVDQLFFPALAPYVVEYLPDGSRIKNLSEKSRKAVETALFESTANTFIEEVFGSWDAPLVGLADPTKMKAKPDLSFDWYSLSGGQQQKIAMARLFLHSAIAQDQGKIPFAVMDESTSQLDHESESNIFNNLERRGINILSVTHRDTVLARHHKMLKLTRLADTWHTEDIDKSRHSSF